MENEENLIIIGEGEFAEIAYQYFTHDSPYNVVAFSVEKAYIDKNSLFGLPIVPFEELEEYYSPEEFMVFVAVTYTKLNRVRTRLYNEVKKKGFRVVSYISSKAFVWNNVEIGENCFIFEYNVIQYRVKIGNNVILWSGNQICHGTSVQDNCFIASNTAISGECDIGENSFLGVNCCLSDHITIAKDNLIGAGAVVVTDTEEAGIYVGNPAKRMEKHSLEVVFWNNKKNLNTS
jgi:sugar O-acyltransferase (sialic acid O-acetyltransferase NeuD family)